MSAEKIISRLACSSTPRIFMLCSVVVLSIAGCASKPVTVGDTMQLERDQYAAISDKWADGEKLVKKGKNLVKKGKKQISTGNENIAEGEQLILKGERMMRDSELEYNMKRATSQ